jgi:proteasome lid subunit RPN8/RPN11
VVSLKSDIVPLVVAHAREASPRECCGLLIGRADCVVEAVRTRNVAENPSRFLLDPKGHIDGRREARQRGLDVVGFYHSHPSSNAQPSATDRAEASYPDHLYLIIGLGTEPAAIALYTLRDGNFLALPFVTVD